MASHSSMLALFGIDTKHKIPARNGPTSIDVVPISPDPEKTPSLLIQSTSSKGSSIPTPLDYESDQEEQRLSQKTSSASSVEEDEPVGDAKSPPAPKQPIYNDDEDIKLDHHPTKRRPGGPLATLLTPDLQVPGRRKSSRISAYSAHLPPKERPPPKKNTQYNRKVQGKVALQGSILTDSVDRRKAYLVANKDHFLPLLPRHNNLIRYLQAEAKAQVHPYVELDQQPEGIRATMKGYQLQGLSFLLHIYRNGMSGILGDEMGLGKTLQTLSLFQQLFEDDKKAECMHCPKKHRPCLVICPLSVLNSWMTESEKWAPELNIFRFHGPKEERMALKRGTAAIRCGCSQGETRQDKSACPPDIIVTTYETLTSEHVWLKRTFNWRCIVLDEGHKVKNHQSIVSKCLMSLKAEARYILTGTPLQNNLLEMWSLLHWMFPDLFTLSTHIQFKSAFDLSKGSVDIPFMESSKSLLELIMLRRMKDSPGVNLGLPPKEEVVLYLPLTPMQQFWYRELLTRSGDSLLETIFKDSRGKEKETKLVADESEAAASDEWQETEEILRKTVASMVNGKSTRQRLLNLLMQLRKCCGHPYLLPGAEPDPYRLGDHVIRASSKFIVLEKLLHEMCVVRKEKVLVFSGFVTVLNYVEDMIEHLSHKGMGVRMLRLDGGTARARRNLNIRLFNDADLGYNVMLISTKAGGLGITLTAATSVVFLDEEWNPQLTKQAEARAHRIGQTRPVTIYKMSTQGTVEQQMLGRIRKKLYLSAKITESLPSFYGAGPSAEKSKHLAGDNDMVQLSSTELMSLIRRGAQTLSHNDIDVTEMLSWDLGTILDKCRERDIDPAAGGDGVEDEEKWLQTMEKVETAVFQGARMSGPTSKPAGAKKTAALLGDVIDVESGSGGGDNGDGAVVVAETLDKAARRVGKNTTVLVNGYHVDKSTLGCKDWEAVATTSGDEPMAEFKRDRREFDWQDRCQACYKPADEDETHPAVQCGFCPRSYHFDCMPKPSQRAYMRSISFSCPQHKCHGCKKATDQAGGMLFRCRWCPGAYCEDCTDFDQIRLVGDHTDEMIAYRFLGVAQVFWIECCDCVDKLGRDRKFGKMVEKWKTEGARMKADAMAAAAAEAAAAAAADADADAMEVDTDHTGPGPDPTPSRPDPVINPPATESPAMLRIKASSMTIKVTGPSTPSSSSPRKRPRGPTPLIASTVAPTATLSAPTASTVGTPAIEVYTDDENDENKVASWSRAGSAIPTSPAKRRRRNQAGS